MSHVRKTRTVTIIILTVVLNNLSQVKC